MSYNIVKSNGTPLTTVADGQTDTITTSLTLIGKNYAGYGTFLNENFVKMLEHFAGSTAPLYPLVGQLWWKADTRVLQVYDQFGNWKSVSGAQSLADQPSNAVAGDLWFDSVNQQLKVFSGAAWVVIGPSFTTTTGTSGAVADTIIDTTLFPHVVVKFYVQNRLVAILSKDATFTPQTTLPGFATVKPGFNLNADNVPALLYYENSNNASYLGGIPAANFLTKTNAVLNNQLVIQNPTGLAIQELGGTVTDFDIQVGGQNVALSSRVRGNGLVIKTTPDSANGTLVSVLTVDKSSGLITVYGDPQTGLGVATKNYVDTLITGVNQTIASDVNTLNSTINTNLFGNLLNSTGTVIGTVASYGNIRQIQQDLGFNNGTVLSLAQGGYTANAYTRFTTGDTFSGNLLTLWANTAAFYSNVLGRTGVAPDGTASMFANVRLLQNTVSDQGISKLERNGANSITGNIFPDADNLYYLGTPGRTFANLYLSNASTPAITHSGTDKVGNIGQSNNRFGVLFTDSINVNSLVVAGAGLSSAVGYISAGNSMRVAGTLTPGGTANVGPYTGNVTVRTIQDISTTATPSFDGATFGTSTVTFGAAPIPSNNGSINLGSASRSWATIYGTATTALYADLAERYHADAEYAPGTVLRIGGEFEVTQENESASEFAFGVVSTNPAHLMNGGAGDNITHPPVALTGRVPVRVIGIVAKGERIVSAGNGVARAALPGEATAFNVIGRALAYKDSLGEALLEIVVSLK